MTIDQKEIQHLARLARLKVDAADEEKFAHDLSEIVGYFDKLKEVATDNVSPDDNTHATSALRDDAVKPFGKEQDLIEQAQDHEGPWVKVPAVFEE